MISFKKYLLIESYVNRIILTENVYNLMGVPYDFDPKKELKAEVIAKSEAYIGGEDIDTWIVEDYLRSHNLKKQNINKIAHQNLLEIAERQKIKLSQQQETIESWFDEQTFTGYEMKINRQKQFRIWVDLNTPVRYYRHN